MWDQSPITQCPTAQISVYAMLRTAHYAKTAPDMLSRTVGVVLKRHFWGRGRDTDG